MASVYPKGDKLWCRVKISGEWRSRPTPYGLGQRAEAKRFAATAQRELDKLEAAGVAAPTGPLTVAAYARQWLPEREQADVDWRKDESILRVHILPAIGDLPIAEVKPAHMAALVRQLRATGAAVRTVRNVYTTARSLFRDAAIAGLVASSPCILTHRQLGRVRDADPEWRAGALFTRDEAERLISDERIPPDRRLVYALGLLAGLRPGEIGALRWRHLELAAEPLGRLQVALSYSSKRATLKGTKTDAVRAVPVHPTLAAMLAEWKLAGWAAMMGRHPTPDDLILPLPPADAARRTTRAGDPFRGDVYTRKRWVEVDEPMLGWRHREVYCTKATFITLAIEDGARPEILRDRVTHTKPRRDAFSGYDRGPHWMETCSEVAKLRLARRLAPAVAPVVPISGEVAELPGSGGGFRTIGDAREDARGSAVIVGTWVDDARHDDARCDPREQSLLPIRLAEAVLAGHETTARRLAREFLAVVGATGAARRGQGRAG